MLALIRLQIFIIYLDEIALRKTLRRIKLYIKLLVFTWKEKQNSFEFFARNLYAEKD